MPIPHAASALVEVTVREAMSPGVLACPPSATLATVAAMMTVREIHAVAVGTDLSKASIVTDRDLLQHAADAGVTAEQAAREAPTIDPEEPLSVAARAMAEVGEGHLMVVPPGADHVVGIVSSFDVAAVLAGRDPRGVRVPRPHAARPSISRARLDLLMVADVMHPGVFACAPDTGLRDVAAMLVSRRTHCLAVGDDGGTVALLSDLDVARAAAEGGERTAGEIATQAPAAWISRSERLDRAADLMARQGRSHLLVGGEQGPEGVLASSDVIAVLAVGAF